jgi:hypothetical protein
MNQSMMNRIATLYSQQSNIYGFLWSQFFNDTIKFHFPNFKELFLTFLRIDYYSHTHSSFLNYLNIFESNNEQDIQEDRVKTGMIKLFACKIDEELSFWEQEPQMFTLDAFKILFPLMCKYPQFVVFNKYKIENHIDNIVAHSITFQELETRISLAIKEGYKGYYEEDGEEYGEEYDEDDDEEKDENTMFYRVFQYEGCPFNNTDYVDEDDARFNNLFINSVFNFV